MTFSLPSRKILVQAFKMAAPIAGAYLVIVLGLVIEFIIVGNYVGEDGVAALGLAGTLCLVLILSFHALEIAAQAIISRRFGEGKRRSAGVCLDNALFVSFALGIPLTLILLALGKRLFGAEDASVEDLAYQYFLYRLPSIPFLIAILAIIGFFNGIGRPTLPAFIYGVLLVTNGLLGWLLVGGELGFPEMGIKGAGLAQTVSALVGFSLFMMLLIRPTFRRRFHCLHFVENVRLASIKPLMKLSAPVFVQQFFGNIGTYLFMVINGKVPDGGTSLAAATIARQVGNLTYLPSIGFGLAAATLMGQALGAGKPKDAAKSAFSCWLLGATLMVITGLIFIVFRHEIADLFLSNSTSDYGKERQLAVRDLTAQLLVIVGCYQLFESVNSIVSKALQGAGDTMFVMMASVGVQWLLYLPLAAFLALGLGYGATGALLAFGFQLFLVSILFSTKFFRGNWSKRSV